VTRVPWRVDYYDEAGLLTHTSLTGSRVLFAPTRPSMRLRQTLLALLFGSTLAGCRTSAASDEPAPSASGESPSAKAGAPGPRFEPAPPGDVPGVVLTAVARAKAEGRRLVVYEGASWCEPCQHFHAAVAQGELNAAFPRLTLLEFDADRDRDRLIAAGYGSQYIPLFALPGGIKGDGVVPYLTKRLEQLLSQGS
jgi:thiol-disulfide isomerase/thioredoxin